MINSCEAAYWLTMIQFEFKGTAFRSGRMPVFVHERGMNQVQEIIDEEEATRKAAQSCSEDDDGGCRGMEHTKQCLDAQDVLPIKCAAEEADDANSSLKALQTIQNVLKNSLNPLLANGEGMITAFKRQRCLHDL
jgi:hypothetical protein